MKKFFIFSALLLAGALFSCRKAAEPDPIVNPVPDPDPLDGKIAVVALLPDGQSWTDYQQLTVTGASKTAIFEIAPGFTTSTAKFFGESVGEGPYTFILGAASMEEALDCDFSSQQQGNNRSKDHFKSPQVVSGLEKADSVCFIKEWAESKGAEFKKSGSFELDVTSPSSTNTIKSLTVKASRAVFPRTNKAGELTDEINIFFDDVDVTPLDKVLTVNIETSWGGFELKSADELLLTLNFTSGKYVTKTISGIEGSALEGGEFSASVDKKSWKGSGTDPGTESNPYKIGTAGELMAMKSLMVQNADEPVFFELTSDVDMAGQTWTPLVTGNQLWPMDFNGKGFKIKNLTIDGSSAFPSFAGVLDGSVHDVTFENPVVESTRSSASQTGVVTGWAGRNSGDIEASIYNVTITGGRISIVNGMQCYAGLIAGECNNATVRNCSVSGEVNATGAVAELNLGGMLGILDSNTTVEDCVSEINVTCSSASRVVGGCIGAFASGKNVIVRNVSHKGSLTVNGGASYSGFFIGHSRAVCIIENCHAQGDFAGAGGRCGGIIGSFFSTGKGSVIKNCTYSGTITTTGKDSYIGGIIGGFAQGGTNDMTVSDCHARCTIDGSAGQNGNIGGILGANWNSATGSVIERCSFEGAIKTGTGSNNGGSSIGGICGYTQSITIRNCRTAGEIINCNYALGGIAGFVYQNCKIENCISAMTVKGRHGIGGIAGRADNNSASAGVGYNNVIKGCIAWNDEIYSRLRLGSSESSAGAVVGKSADKNTHRGCLRKSDLIFDCYSDESYNVLFDQEDNDDTGTLDIKQSLGSNYYPYHGKATSGTASQAALAIGWSADIWDMTGDEPKLKSETGINQ